MLQHEDMFDNLRDLMQEFAQRTFLQGGEVWMEVPPLPSHRNLVTCQGVPVGVLLSTGMMIGYSREGLSVVLERHYGVAEIPEDLLQESAIAFDQRIWLLDGSQWYGVLDSKSGLARLGIEVKHTRGTENPQDGERLEHPGVVTRNVFPPATLQREAEVFLNGVRQNRVQTYSEVEQGGEGVPLRIFDSLSLVLPEFTRPPAESDPPPVLTVTTRYEGAWNRPTVGSVENPLRISLVPQGNSRVASTGPEKPWLRRRGRKSEIRSSDRSPRK